MLVRAIIAEIGVIQGRRRAYLQGSGIKIRKKRNVSFVSKLTSLGVYCAEGGKKGMRAGNRAVPVGIADSECIVVLVWV